MGNVEDHLFNLPLKHNHAVSDGWTLAQPTGITLPGLEASVYIIQQCSLELTLITLHSLLNTISYTDTKT